MNEPLKAVETSEGLLRGQGAKVWSYPANLSKPDAPRWLFENVIADLNGLDLLVNNAGVNIPRAIQDITEDNFDYLVGLDFRVYVMLMHYASRYMIDNHIQGNIINITSSRGERAYANAGLYCGIKAGLNKMTEAFALDLSAYGISINNVAPGAVRVRGKEELLDIKATDYYWSEKYLDDPQAVEVDFWDSLGPKITM